MPYGRSCITAYGPDHFQYTVLAPLDVDPVTEPEKEIRNALENPIGHCNLEKLRAAKNVAVVISDISRPVPNKLILRELFKWLEFHGVARKAIKVMIGAGLHRPATLQDIEVLLGAELSEDRVVISHDARKEDDLIYMGTSSRGTPIYINRHYLESDYRILVGMIEPHQFVGYTGGAKSLTIGLGGEATISGNHALLKNSQARVGLVSGNPAREEIDEIGERVGIDAIINVVLNTEKKLVKAVAGHYLDAHRTGVEIAKEIAEVELCDRADVVIASPGGFPKDANLYQAQKALNHASMVVKEGGTIILVVEGAEGAGDSLFLETMAQAKDPSHVITQFEDGPFRMGAHKAYLWAKTLIKARTILVSHHMDPYVARTMMTEQVSTLQEAINVVTARLPAGSKIVLMPVALSTIPISSEARS